MNPVDILRESAKREEERKNQALIPISVATGTGGAALGQGFDSVVNRIRRMQGNKATSYGGRLAGAAIAGLAGALGVENMPNRSASILAKASTGGEMSREDINYIERMAYEQARMG